MENTDYKKHQVFINFRGKDERYKFVSHLKYHLTASNVNVFTDEDAPGEPLENLFKQIRKSRIAIVLFSKNYAKSAWCLDELVEIKKCIETEKLDFVIPIFYKVKASSVNKQSGKFGEKFLALQKSLLVEDGNKKKRKKANSKIKRWKKALEVVTGMTGLTFEKKTKSPELDFVMKVVEKVNINLAKIEAEEKSKLHISKSTGDLSGPSCHPQEPALDLRLERGNLEYYEEMFETRRGYRRVASFHNGGDQFYPLSVEKVWASKPVVEAPKPVVDAPKPVIEAPKPVVDAPKPVAEAPKPVIDAPKRVIEAPKRVTKQWSMRVVLIRLCVTVLWCFITGAKDYPEDWWR